MPEEIGATYQNWGDLPKQMFKSDFSRKYEEKSNKPKGNTVYFPVTTWG
jgi:hypothetical protein